MEVQVVYPAEITDLKDIQTHLAGLHLLDRELAHWEPLQRNKRLTTDDMDSTDM